MQENNPVDLTPEAGEVAGEQVSNDPIHNFDLPDISSTEEKDSVPSETETSKTDVGATTEEDYELFETGDPESATPSEQEDLVGETKSRRFFRLLFRWSAGILIIFGLGLITGIYGLYRPTLQEAERSKEIADANLASAQDQIAELESKIISLEKDKETLQPLSDTNLELLETQNALNLHIYILDARVDVISALLAVSQDDNAGASVLLSNTPDTLDKIEALLEPNQQERTIAMKQRLEQIMGELEDDPYTAQSDLDVLSNWLLQLEDSLIAK